LIGDHLWAIVPVRKTRTRSPTATHKIRPLSAFLMISVVPVGLAGAAWQLVAAVRAIAGAVTCGWPHAAVRPAAPASIVPRSIAALRMLTSGSRRMSAVQAGQAPLPATLLRRTGSGFGSMPLFSGTRIVKPGERLQRHQDHGIAD
jgi:hypothetical protein